MKPTKDILHWSPRAKHTGIRISGQSIHKQGAAEKVVCCITTPLNKTQTCKWAVRVQFLFGLIVGICEASQAAKHQFQRWGWGSLGHGHYCFGSNGYVMSHTDANSNGQWKSAEFRTEDVLSFEYDPTIGLLKVSNSDTGQQLKIEKGREYVFCAYLYSLSDSVQLVGQ